MSELGTNPIKLEGRPFEHDVEIGNLEFQVVEKAVRWREVYDADSR